MKKKILQILSLLLLAGAIFLCLYRLNFVLRDKQYTGMWEGYKNFTPETIDVVFIGNSHQFCSINPMDLYEQHGISSYMLASSAQTIPMSYYAAKQAITDLHPAVIVLEASYVANDFKAVTGAMSHCFFDGMPLGKIRTEAIEDLITEEDKIYYKIPLGLYHSRWSELTKEDFMPTHLDERGGVHYEESIYNPDIELVDESQTEDMPSEMKRYLDMLVSLCKENNVRLVIYVAPFNTLYDYDDDLTEDLFKRQRIFNTLNEYAESNDIRFYNLFYKIHELGIDNTDWMDRQHLNYNGASKVTDWIANILF